MASYTVGILALQGAVEPHFPHFEALGYTPLLVKNRADLSRVDALLLPGGESSTMIKLLHLFDMWEPLKQFVTKKPVWGICAGAILLSSKVLNPEQQSLNALPITIKRNGYGRQIDSTESTIEGYPVSFIRAPIITEVDNTVSQIASWKDSVVWVKKDLCMATTFHPELTKNYPSPMHKAFISLL